MVVAAALAGMTIIKIVASIMPIVVATGGTIVTATGGSPSAKARSDRLSGLSSALSFRGAGLRVWELSWAGRVST